MERLGIELLSVFALPPVEFVHLAADLGCASISTGLTQLPYNPHGYPEFSLRDDAALRKAMRAALDDRGVTISLGEGNLVRPDTDVHDLGTDLDTMAELGVTLINTVSLDPDRNRSFDQFAALAELAADRGMQTTIEVSPGLTVPDLDTALAAVHHVGRRDFRLLVDTMHIVRSGATVADVAALDPDLVAYVQLSDAPLTPRFDSYLEEAMYERLVPGEGELPLRDLLAVLPRDVPVSLEVPRRSLAEAGVGPEDRLRPCIQAARALLP
ncbi:MAG TPA: TIM barrel protein [Acidimicrobiia bacterium]|jgi:sugar phosphate isomerase/epimerase